MKQPRKQVQCLHFLLPSNTLHHVCTSHFHLIKLSEEKLSHPCVPERVFCKKPLVVLLKSLGFFGHSCRGSSWLSLNLFHCTFSSSKSHCKILVGKFFLWNRNQTYNVLSSSKHKLNLFRCFNKYVLPCWLFKSL